MFLGVGTEDPARTVHPAGKVNPARTEDPAMTVHPDGKVNPARTEKPDSASCQESESCQDRILPGQNPLGTESCRDRNPARTVNPIWTENPARTEKPVGILRYSCLL
ncbi:hypothetical protein BaRGS_00001067 [Batillaria attramentaria]|uniref:Uncharacterized protein n=1 Tax=Batillaria attramentaria TaxID=370345 RepID=A0ABD0M754_9CAEN